MEIIQRIAAKLEIQRSKLASEEGVTAVEYGLIASLIAIGIIAGVTLVGTNLNSLFNYIAGKVTPP